MLERKDWAVPKEIKEENALAYIGRILSLNREQLYLIRKYHLAGVNNQFITETTLLHAGDNVSVTIPDQRPKSDEPEPIPLNILFEDEILLVLNKPRGMCVIPGPDNWTGTVLNALKHYLGKDTPSWIIHRIDKYTSGCLLIAKTKKAAGSLSKQIETKTCFRVYTALCEGILDTEGTIDAPIGRDPSDFRRMAVTEINSKPACTHYRRKEVFPHASEAQFRLETGRTHQIRVHAAYIHHPLIGDDLYGTPCPLTDRPGAFLHAEQILFDHPVTGQRITMTAEPPEEYINMKTMLKKDS